MLRQVCSKVVRLLDSLVFFHLLTEWIAGTELKASRCKGSAFNNNMLVSLTLTAAQLLTYLAHIALRLSYFAPVKDIGRRHIIINSMTDKLLYLPFCIRSKAIALRGHLFLCYRPYTVINLFSCLKALLLDFQFTINYVINYVWTIKTYRIWCRLFRHLYMGYRQKQQISLCSKSSPTRFCLS